MTSGSQGCRVHRRQILALANVILAGTLTTACTSEGAPKPTATTRGPSLADCRTYGVSRAPVTLKLPGMVQDKIGSLKNPNDHGGPRLAMSAVDERDSDRTVNATASLFDGPTRLTPHWIRNAIYVANSDEASQWRVKNVAEEAITLSATPDTAQATDISHSTFTADGTDVITFDYWAFTASGHRYMLSYARRPAAKTPDAATFFATATSCPKSTQ